MEFTQNFAYQKQEIKVGRYSTAQISLLNNSNLYFLSNAGVSPVYVGFTSIPTEDAHAFIVKGKSVRVYMSPMVSRSISITNPSGTDINVHLESMGVPLDPGALVMSNLEIDLSNASFTASTEISSFKTPLPAGTNNIGRVTLETLPALPAGNNLIGRVDVSTLPTYIQTLLQNILEAVGGTPSTEVLQTSTTLTGISTTNLNLPPSGSHVESVIINSACAEIAFPGPLRLEMTLPMFLYTPTLFLPLTDAPVMLQLPINRVVNWGAGDTRSVSISTYSKNILIPEMKEALKYTVTIRYKGA